MIIYKVTNRLNGMVYIGQTSRSLNRRISEHLSNNRTSYFDRALRKYGINNFNIEIIDIATSKEELNEKEKYYIEYYDSKIPNGYNMYNMTDGEEGKRKTCSGFRWCCA